VDHVVTVGEGPLGEVAVGDPRTISHETLHGVMLTERKSCFEVVTPVGHDGRRDNSRVSKQVATACQGGARLLTVHCTGPVVKVYPKVPRHDHPVVPDGFFDRVDLELVEKYDGSSFRVTLYEERYADRYPEQVTDAADGDGSLVFGTQRTVRGCHRDSLEDIDGALHRAVRCLRDGVDTEALRAAHDEHGPLVV
jgi:hypothetical protein